MPFQILQWRGLVEDGPAQLSGLIAMRLAQAKAQANEPRAMAVELP